MSQINPKLILDFIKQQYRPYDTHDEFGRGFAAYQDGDCRNPNEPGSLPGRAWDFGVAAAERCGKAVAA